MINTLSYRIYEPRDLTGILQLWEKYSGWGGITEDQFRNWYLDTPHGPCLIVVATDENQQIVGQLVFIPAMVWLQQRAVKALRLSSPILDYSFRMADLRSPHHPTNAMMQYGLTEARQKGFTVAYTFPAIGWIPLLKLFPKFGLPPVETASYKCFTIPLDDVNTLISGNQNLIVQLHQGSFGSEYNLLWEEAKANLPITCGIDRNASVLNYKLADYLVLEVRQKENLALMGYVAIKPQTGLLVDLLASTPSETDELLVAVLHAVHHLNHERIPLPFREINGMYTPLLELTFRNLKFSLKKFQFAFGCLSLDETITADAIHPANWYLMPND